MAKIKKILVTVLMLTLIPLFIAGILFVTNPITRPLSSVRRYMLRQIPIGASMEDVIRIVDSNENWTTRHIREQFGVVLLYGTSLPSSFTPREGSVVIGDQSMRVHLGTYHIIIRIDVSAYFAFDNDGKLIDILIRRELDLL